MVNHGSKLTDLVFVCWYLKGLGHGCPAHFVDNANYASLLAMELKKLLVTDFLGVIALMNNKNHSLLQTNMSLNEYIKRNKRQKWTLINC